MTRKRELVKIGSALSKKANVMLALCTVGCSLKESARQPMRCEMISDVIAFKISGGPGGDVGCLQSPPCGEDPSGHEALFLMSNQNPGSALILDYC